ncbi:hypothetical protein APHNP_0936 [Anaplasma phagocytophilum str. ApNP]|uniref:Uncharacterized protein n=1 Tax=Anaplasma phagocytophilum str. ApNP TaxID=1359153 RepID=A0A0F3NF73_ANAPH|nr:hypothetical protein APHNP_0936 [Anaplasma phagocytophilum str. ApNP]
MPYVQDDDGSRRAEFHVAPTRPRLSMGELVILVEKLA